MHWMRLCSDNLFSLSLCRDRRELRDVNELYHFTWLEILPVQLLWVPPIYTFNIQLVFPPENSWDEGTGVHVLKKGRQAPPLMSEVTKVSILWEQRGIFGRAYVLSCVCEWLTSGRLVFVCKHLLLRTPLIECIYLRSPAPKPLLPSSLVWPSAISNEIPSFALL